MKSNSIVHHSLCHSVSPASRGRRPSTCPQRVFFFFLQLLSLLLIDVLSDHCQWSQVTVIAGRTRHIYVAIHISKSSSELTKESPALSGDAVAVGPGVGSDAVGRTSAALAAQQGVEAERLVLTHVTGGSDGLRRADAASGHFVTQSAAALTRCGGMETVMSLVCVSVVYLTIPAGKRV